MSQFLFRRPRDDYDATASAAVVAAQEEAAALRHAAVRPEHFLLGVLAVPGPGRSVLEDRFGVDLDIVRRAVAERQPPGARVRRGGPTFDPSTRPVLDRAAEAARAAGEPEVTSAHILLGVIGAGGLAAELLRERGVDVQRVQSALRGDDSAQPQAAGAQGLHRVLPLAGTAADWEAQLDAVAADGWTVVGVAPVGDEVRAVLRRS